ncbi:MAG: Hsp20/alpha crystallin family protein [Candidatus Thiodiazotropha taylori]|uniref:Hsp20/alpha crystallin family protein n=1 Tax=Candidatus Thiodiazotropha taylori TaxID=2792791 RepID=A0A9E4T449_9GAMM|nr:Hsp20/alpha crystallin family protein [Candidatus Thiodiazotropha taylori]MCG8068625.1 Hsp20/alpha crystallin family protein [Candidatus Thiodiazotropha taylori]MCW4228290.1 Hsp20/alpha crystallin family protein [Candidatus Thiodiazotropha taylori]MCW4258383.1 Hsp20/alpha crystallin family protein [Candidatus Thiodiazotropha taylori]
MNKRVPLIGLLLGACLVAPVTTQAFDYRSGSSHRAPLTQGSSFHTQKSIKFQRYQDEQGYHLRILSRGYAPESIQVEVSGPYLLVKNQEAHRVENRNERGYSFTSSSSSMNRRFRLPGNADVAGMSRSEEDGVITITLPYRY